MSLRGRWMLLAMTLAALLLAPAMSWGATQNAVLYGAVYDAAGNPAAGITVSLENSAIGFARTTITAADGSYNFPEVPPAENYLLLASRGNAKIDARSGIVVNVGDEKVVLPPLKERPVAVTTTVTAPTPVAAMQAVSNETVSTAISGVITGEQLRALPVAINRNFLNAGLIPPDTHDVEQGSQLAGASFSVAGNRPQANNFLLDGSDNVASSTNQAVPFQVNDSVQEFRVTSSTANAEYGRNMGGTVNIVTKRASNKFHGSVFGYFNNDSLNASSPVSVYNGTTFDKAAAYAGPVNSTFNAFLPLTYNDYVAGAKNLGFCTNSISSTPAPGLGPCPTTDLLDGLAGLPTQVGQNSFFNPAAILATHDSHNIPFDSKQFGVNLGGPIVRDRLFVFGSYEGTLIDNPSPIFERVPSAFDRTYNPYASPFIAFAQNNPNYAVGQNILSLFPASNLVGVPGVLEFFQGQAPNYTNVHNGLFRSDWNYSQKTTYSLRYVVQDLDQLHDDTLPQRSQYAGSGAFRQALNQNLNLTFEHTFSSHWVTDARVGFNRFQVSETPQDQGLDATQLGLPSPALPTILLNGLDPQYGGAQPGLNGAFAGWSDLFFGFRTFGVLPTLDGLFPFARLGAPLGAPLNRRDTTLFAASNTSWSHGRHDVKFGTELRRLDNSLEDDSFARGFMYSGDIGEFTSDSETLNDGASVPLFRFNAFRAPSFDFYQQQNSDYQAKIYSYGLSAYIQDTWHVHPRVTINAGLRYEYNTPPQSKSGSDTLWNFDPVANGLVQTGHFGVISPLVEDPYGNRCGGTTRFFPSVPADLVFGSFFPGNGTWSCNSQPSDFNQIQRANLHNFAPRLGVAWDLFGNGKTVLRAAAGVFFDQVPASEIEQLMDNRPTGLNNPNALYGVIRPTTGGFCPLPDFACGVGTSIVQPGVQNAISNDGVNANFLFSQADQPFAVYAIDTHHSGTPFSRQVSATLQQQLTGKVVLEVGYIGNAGYNLPVVFNSNLGNEANLLRNGAAGNFSLVPIFTLTNQAESSYNSLLVRARVADWHGLQLNGSYAWARSIDNSSDAVFPPLPLTLPNLSVGYGFFAQFNPVPNCLFLGVDCTFTVTTPTGATFTEQNPLTLPVINFSPGAVTTTGAGQVLTSRYLLPQDPFHFLVNDRGLSDFDIRHRFVLDYIWNVPSLHERLGAPTWLDHWQLSGVFTAQSGQPFSIFAGPIAGEITQRVNVTGPVDITNNSAGAISTSNLQLASASTACSPPFTNTPVPAPGVGSGFLGNFLQPAPGVTCDGNSGRNSFIGPGYVNLNVAIQKGFTIFGEGHTLTFRTELYNVLNHANFFNPISQLSFDGVTPNPDFGKIKSAHEPRQIQFAVRYSW